MYLPIMNTNLFKFVTTKGVFIFWLNKCFSFFRNTKLDIKHKKHSKKEGKKYNNFIFLKKLKHFFNKNINTPFVVTNLKRFVFMIGKYILHNPFEVYNFLFSNKKQILKTNLISLSKILKLMNKKQIKFVSKFAKQKLNNI